MRTPVFFTYDYEHDTCRAHRVIQTWTDAGGEALGCWDHAVWATAMVQRGQLNRLIDEAVARAVATVVLITQRTADQKYVQYALRRSHEEGKRLLGVYIHRIPDEKGRQASLGHTRFGEIGVDEHGQSLFFWQRYPAYRWVIDDGPSNFVHWVARAVDGRYPGMRP